MEEESPDSLHDNEHMKRSRVMSGSEPSQLGRVASRFVACPSSVLSNDGDSVVVSSRS